MEGMPSASVTAWLGGPPRLGGPGDLLVSLVGDVLALIEPYHDGTVYSAEPRLYRTSPRGMALLDEAIASGQVESLLAGSPAHIPLAGPASDEGDAIAEVEFGRRDFANAIASVGLTIRPGAGVTIPDVADHLVAFVGRWFVPLKAYSAFVSMKQRQGLGTTIGQGPVDDSPGATSLKSSRGVPRLGTWPSLRRYARGAFWGNGLGPELCARLGGQERVLREAPAWQKRPLGDGVWLQLSEQPPGSPEARARLAEFLAPLLDWTWEELRRLHMQPSVPEFPRAPAEEQAGGPGPTEPPGGAPRSRRSAVPVRWLSPLGDRSLGLNVYLGARPDAAQLARLIAMVEEWLDEGSNGAFGDGSFYNIRGPSIGGAVLRWQFAPGDADHRLAIRALARRLAAVSGVRVARLVVGIEEVG